MKKPNKFSNLKFKWWFWLIILFLVLGGFLIYRLIKSPPQDFLNLPSEIFPSLNSSPQIEENLNKEADKNLSDCVSEERPLKVRGNSLAGLVEDGAVLKILMGYYKCHPVERDDIIVYNYPGGDPLVKIAKGISGDKFQLKESAAGCWNILINDKIIKNSQNLPYCISEQGYRMLSLYEKDYSGVIPQDAYLILGNSTGGSLDSTRFGLVGKNDILGKAIR